MQGLTLLGVLIVVLTNVFLATGSFQDTRVGWDGLNRINPTHTMDITSLYTCDNYSIAAKDEEDPAYSVLSVRPDKTNYLNATGGKVRGLWDYTTSGGDNLIIMADGSTVYKSGTIWTTLEAGFNDNPWEGNLYSLPNITRLYLCNGIDDNRKFYSGRNTLFKMQNQDSETLTGGTIYFTNNSISATGDSTAIAALTAGQYVKSSTSADDSLWVEIASKESATAITFSTRYTGTTASSTLCVRSNDVGNSRHMIEYEGHEILGYTNGSNETTVTTTASTEYYQLNAAYGVAQSWEAASASFNKLNLVIWRGAGTTGNIVIKHKASLTGAALRTITYAVANLPTSAQTVSFDFGNTTLTSGATYYFTVERENSSVSPVYVRRADGYTGGVAHWTYASGGFATGWNTGVTTIESAPVGTYGDTLDNYDTYMDANSPGNTPTSYDYLWSSSSPSKEIIVCNTIEAVYSVKSDASNYVDVKYCLWNYANITFVNTLEVYRILADTTVSQISWNTRKTGVAWGGVGCTLEGTDYTTSDAASVTINTTMAGGRTLLTTCEITEIANNWTVAAANNNGILFKVTSLANDRFISNNQITANPSNLAYVPKWILTVNTGSTETTQDVWFQIEGQSQNSSTVLYSKRFKPENFPTLNTFQVPGTIVGMAKSGGYLIIGSEKPDALHFYNATYDTADGAGIKDTTRIDGITFGGGSHSIAYLPKEDSFIFYSGLGVYLQKGLQTTLLSGKIRDEAKQLTNYRDPLDYYGGYADMQPWAVVDPTKDLYMLAVPKALSVNSYLYNFNYANAAWVRWTSLYPTAMLCRQERGNTPTLYMGSTTGQVSRLNKTGSISNEAVLSWFYSFKDLTKKKRLDVVELIGRADNPLTGCIVSLEVQSTNPTANDEYTTAKRQTITVTNNATTDGWVRCLFTDIGVSARELKLTLTQSSSVGAVSWRAIKYKGAITEP